MNIKPLVLIAALCVGTAANAQVATNKFTAGQTFKASDANSMAAEISAQAKVIADQDARIKRLAEHAGSLGKGLTEVHFKAKDLSIQNYYLDERVTKQDAINAYKFADLERRLSGVQSK